MPPNLRNREFRAPDKLLALLKASRNGEQKGHAGMVSMLFCRVTPH